MASKVAYFVFLAPLAFSIILGTGVMTQIIQEPGRELNMWRINFSDSELISEKSIQIIGVKKQYSILGLSKELKILCSPKGHISF